MSRRHLSSGRTPHTGLEQLLSHIRQLSSNSSPAGKDDLEMLSLIVDEALQGVDIEQEYPQFFAKMLRTPSLYEAFVDSLEMLEDERDGKSEPLPFPPSRDLSFLANLNPKRKISQPSPTSWQITFQQTIQQLQQVFGFLTPAPLMRHDFEEDGPIILFRDRLELAGRSLNLLLEGEQPTPETLQLFVKLGNMAPLRPEIQLHLTWAGYDQQLILTPPGRYPLPPIPLATVWDESQRSFTAGLQLELKLANLV